MAMTESDLIARFQNVKKTGKNTYQACCPAHKDKNPSLTITITHEKILLHCHAGCSPEQVVHAVGLQMGDLFFDKKPIKQKEVARYEYRNASGDLQYTKVRYEPKTFLFFDASGKPGLNGAHHILYRLPDILKAKSQNHAIFLCEGEKDADTIREKAQCDSTSLDCGALPTNAPESRLKPLDELQGAIVYIIPDQDRPGKINGDTCAKYLYGKAKELYIVNIPDGKDITEYFERGHSPEEFKELCANTIPWSPDTNGWTIQNLSANRFFTADPVPFEFIIPGLLAKGLVGFIYGEGGSYKSLAALWLCLQLAVHRIDNTQKWLDRFELTSCKSIFFSAEDLDSDLHHRVRSIVSKMRRDDIPENAYREAITENCLIVSREQLIADGEIFLVDENGTPTEKVQTIIDLINQFGADLVIIETVSRISAVDENDNAMAARLVAAMEIIRDKTGATVLLIAHSSKISRFAKTDTFGQNGLRGAGAFLDNARFGLWFRSLERKEKQDRLEILNSKSFRCKRADPFKVKISYPRFELDEDEIEPDVFEAVIEFIRCNPGTNQRKIRNGVKGKMAAINRAIRDAIDEGIITHKGKNGGYSVNE